MTLISVAATNGLTFERNLAETVILLEQCSNLQELKQLHARMLKTGLIQESVAVSKLLSFCMSSNSCNLLPYAKMVFDSYDRPNTFMWNIMIRGYSNSDEPESALTLYHKMLLCSAPHNTYTFPFLLKACANLSAYEETRQIHARVIKLGFFIDVHTANSLIQAYAVSGHIQYARLLFDSIPEHDIVSWNSIINGFSKFGEMETALEFFRNMPEKNVISWTTMISGYVQAGMNKEALDLFHEMQNSDIEPDNVALANALSACAQLGALEQGIWIHTYIKKRRIKIDSIMSCVLIDMYAKCGDVEEAIDVFRKLNKKSVHAWTAVISGLANHGYGREALDQFMQMQKTGIKPNPITFTAVLTACSYSGLVGEGKALFYSMEKNHNLKPTIEHYGCMVDMLSRAGLLHEAKEFIHEMPLSPNAVIWGTLLKACRIHKNVELGKEIGEMLIEMDPNHGGRYIHLANIHAIAGKWDQAVETRKLMKERRVLKIPGCSAISVNGQVHEFVAGDRSHQEIKEINSKWDEIKERLREKGYVPALDDVPLDLDDQEKKAAIHQHSEKLAITYGLIKSKLGNTIRVVKNLRICEDCHRVTKLISKIYERDVVIRDRTRFHHFRDGKCSCGDYW